MQESALHATDLPAPSGSAITYNLAGIAALVLLAAVGLAYGLDQISRASHPSLPALEDGDPITQTIAGKELAIPSRWFRYGEQVRDGFTSQIDLRVMFAANPDAAPMPIDVTLLPPSRARTSASLLDAVYLHQFGAETLIGVPGLVGKPMLNGSGYADESVWYDAISATPFVAKCASGIGERPAQCVRTVYLPSGIAAVYTFDTAALQSWQAFDEGMQQWLGAIGAW